MAVPLTPDNDNRGVVETGLRLVNRDTDQDTRVTDRVINP